MTRKTKILIALMTTLIGVVIILSGIYWLTIGHTERTKETLIDQARERLTEEQPTVKASQADLYNGTASYVVFTDQKESVIFVPTDKKLPIVNREIGSIDLQQVCDQSLEETGGALVSCKYGFDDRALIEVVSKTGASYTYSYYTLQSGEFIRRVELTD